MRGLIVFLRSWPLLLALLVGSCASESASSSQPLEPVTVASQDASASQETPVTAQPSEPSLPCHAEVARASIVTLFAGVEIGTGSIVSSNGLVLTNEHVVREVGSRGEVHVRRWGGRLYKGQVLATDAPHDLALVQIKAQEQFPSIAFASPETIQNGQPVCALGSPRAITGVLAQGKLLGKRGASDFKSAILLQPGNSGGPLLNEQGAMIGVNKSVWLSDTGQNLGFGFATDVTVAEQFFERHKAKALPASSLAAQALPPSSNEPAMTLPSGHLGVILDEKTLVVQIVEPDSPAERAGLNAGDRLLQVDRLPVKRLADIKALLSQQPQQAVFTVTCEIAALRDGTTRDVVVTF